MICDDSRLMAAIVIGVCSVVSVVFSMAHLRQSLKNHVAGLHVGSGEPSLREGSTVRMEPGLNRKQ